MTDNLIHFFSGATVAIIASCITHLFSESREKRNIFNKAAEKFRLAFWPTVEFLDKQYLVDRASIHVTMKSWKFLSKAVSKHQKAVFRFEPYLGFVNRYRLRRAWKQYCKESNNQHYFAEEYPCDDDFKQYDSEKKALDRINKILKFAKPK